MKENYVIEENCIKGGAPCILIFNHMPWIIHSSSMQPEILYMKCDITIISTVIYLLLVILSKIISAEFSVKVYHCFTPSRKIPVLVPENSMTNHTENKSCFYISTMVSNCITLNRLDLLAQWNGLTICRVLTLTKKSIKESIHQWYGNNVCHQK